MYLKVYPGAQAITGLTATPAAPVFATDSSFTVAATGGASGNPVTFTSSSTGVCTVAGNTVSVVSAGTCTLLANQLGDANYNAATQATWPVTIGKASQAISGFTATPAAPVFAAGGSFTLATTGGHRAALSPLPAAARACARLRAAR